MRGLGEYLTKRLLGYLVVLVAGIVLSFAGISRAEAQTDPYASCQTTAQTGACATQTIAAQRATLLAENNKPTGNGYPYMCSKKTTNSLRWEAYYTTLANCGGFAFTVYSRTWPAGTECPNGIDPATGYCLPDQAQCLARNTLAGFANPGITSRNYSAKCINGCNFAMNGGTVTTSPNGTGIVANGTFTWTGTCANPDPVETVTTAAQPKPQECIQIADAAGSACVKANGQHCHKASTGFQACWYPGETGEKVVGDVLQKRVAGTDEIPPNLNLLNGDTLTKQPPSITTTTTNTTTNKTTTTTTTNYVTTNGTSPPGTPAGEPDNGTGGDEGDDGEAKSSTGGANCEESDKPLTQGDPILGNLVEQAWRTRCAVESGNAVTSTGVVDDCATDFTVTGPPKSVEVLKLKALRKSICPDKEAIVESDFLGDGSNEVTDGSSMFADVGDGTFSGWDMSGFGFGQSCPALPVVTIFGKTYDMGANGRNAAACDIATLLGWFVLFSAGLACLRIVTEA